MTRKQAVNYLKSSGFSDEQIRTIEDAFINELSKTTISRQAVIDRLYDLEEAYQKGLQHGQELRAKEAECAEACGMKRAWEAARKIVLTKENGGIPLSDLNEIFGAVNVLKEFSASEAIEKIEAWEKKQDAPDGSIKVGDEVRMIGSDPKLDGCDYGVCTMVKPKTIYVMRMDGSVGEEDKEEWEKTGDHYNIQHILDQMKEHEVKE